MRVSTLEGPYTEARPHSSQRSVMWNYLLRVIAFSKLGSSLFSSS